MRTYTLYTVDAAPAELLAKHLTPALYTHNGQDFYLFCESLEEVTGTPAVDPEEVDKQGFNYPYDANGHGLTEAALNGRMNALFAGPASTKEIHLSRHQGRHMWESLWKPED
jgi:hypothetical protein